MATATVAVLKRAPLGMLVVPPRYELLEKARAVLGYCPTELKTCNQMQVEGVHRTVLAAALTQLGIDPLTLESVRAYKVGMVEKAVAKGSSQFVLTMHGEGERVVVLLTILNILWSIACAFLAGHATSGPMEMLVKLSTSYWGASLLTVWAVWGVLMFARHKQAVLVQAGWRTVNLSHHTQPIPEFVISDMLALKEVLPETVFSVDEFIAESRQLPKLRSQVQDPFLIAHYNGVSVYLHVWNEPSFEGRRTI